jgi:membrane protease YdiL (CAAX protease family)
MSEAPTGGRWLVPLAVAFEGGLAALAWGAAWLLGLPLANWLWWDPLDVVLGVAACLPMLGLFWMCLHAPLPPLQRLRELSRTLIRPLFAGCDLAELALISLMAGLSEELLFRGVLQTFLTDRLGLWAGLALASLIFGLLHAITPTYAVFATLLGAYLGALWELNGNLLVVIVAHGLYDFLALVYLTRAGMDRG